MRALFRQIRSAAMMGEGRGRVALKDSLAGLIKIQSFTELV